MATTSSMSTVASRPGEGGRASAPCRSGGTVIGFDLPREARVKLELFDLTGRRVRVLAERSYAPGRWTVEWDRRDGAGSPMRPGVYLYRLRAGTFQSQRKMVLMP